MNIEIGTVYTANNKRKDVCTVVDIHKTYNNAGELVKTRYVATHVFMGQTVYDYDVVATTIQRALFIMTPKQLKQQKIDADKLAAQVLSGLDKEVKYKS